MDSISKEHRSWTMSQVHSKDTKPELLVRSYLHKNGFRYRLHDNKMPGHPDIVLPKFRTVVEVRGCFWHRHPGCKATRTPLSNTEFWQEKFRRNVERDKKHADELKALGWHLIVVWECETAKKRFPPKDLGEFVSTHSHGSTIKLNGFVSEN